MPIKELRRIRLSSEFTPPVQNALPWLWSGYLLPGDITLMTSAWKTGKTTLLAGLLQSLGTGTPFLNRPTRPARAWIVSEESESQWGERLRSMPLGPHVELLSRPFPGRPTSDEWNFLIDRAADAAVAEKLELVVIDPLASFLPGRCESDAGTLLEALQPLHRLTTAGVAVLLLHHPRKKSAEVGSSARGSGALLGFVDCSVELTRYSKLKTDFQRRLLSAPGDAGPPRLRVGSADRRLRRHRRSAPAAARRKLADDPRHSRRSHLGHHGQGDRHRLAGRRGQTEPKFALRLAESRRFAQAGPPRGERIEPESVAVPVAERGRRIPRPRGTAAAEGLELVGVGCGTV